jgi:hypothetical protein
MDDPVFLALVGVVIFLTLALVILLGLWVRKLLRENNSLRASYPQTESKGDYLYSLSLNSLVDTLVHFALAYRDRVQARGKKVDPANEQMRLCWERLPKEYQEVLIPLGMRADLKVSE